MTDLIPQAQGTSAVRSGTAAPGKRNKINMEAYQAYYNTNEAEVMQPKANALEKDTAYPKTELTSPMRDDEKFDETILSVKDKDPKKEDPSSARGKKSGKKEDPKVLKNEVHID